MIGLWTQEEKQMPASSLEQEAMLQSPPHVHPSLQQTLRRSACVFSHRGSEGPWPAEMLPVQTLVLVWPQLWPNTGPGLGTLHFQLTGKTFKKVSMSMPGAPDRSVW